MQALSAACALFGLSIGWAAVAQTSSPEPKSWLFQNVHVTGDVREGFKKTCLIVYPNGEYHHERRQQVSTDGRAQFDWEAPEVFEAKLSPTNFSSLRTILEAPEFAVISGVTGDSRSLRGKVAFNQQGAIRPEENIEIVTVAVSRPNGPQVFELADFDVARRQERLRTLLDWLKGTERSQARRLAASQASNCSPLIGTANASVDGAPTAIGLSPPKPIYTPSPRPPHGTQKPKPVMIELLVGPDGSVAEAVLKGRPKTDVAQPALETVRKWKFQPARLLGVPIASTIDVQIEFRSK